MIISQVVYKSNRYNIGESRMGWVQMCLGYKQILIIQKSEQQKQTKMRSLQQHKQAPYRRNSYRQNSKPYYNGKEEQKSSYNYIEETKIRIVQDNLVSVTGLPIEYDDPDLLGDSLHFGKYGTVEKIIISSQGKHNRTAFIQVYITYEKPIHAAFAIKALDGIKIRGREITATFGTTKYCTYFLKNIQCRNERCFYLHSYDTKNQLMDGVKNNMDFLDEKSQKIINDNLKYYLERLLDEEEMKEEISQFPTIGETIQYLIEERVLQEENVLRGRKEIIAERKKGKTWKENESSGEKEREKERKNSVKEGKQTVNKPKQTQINTKPSQKQKSPIKQSLPKPEPIPQPSVSNKTNDDREQSERILQQAMITQNQSTPSSSIDQNKSKKCHSLSTSSSPQKYEKLAETNNQNIDKTIEKRIIKQIMRTNIIFRSRMEFVTKVTNNDVKEENNKIKNYVRKYLLNQL